MADAASNQCDIDTCEAQGLTSGSLGGQECPPMYTVVCATALSVRPYFFLTLMFLLSLKAGATTHTMGLLWVA